MIEPSSEHIPTEPLKENSGVFETHGIRQSLHEENDLHIQAMQPGYGRNYRQHPNPQPACRQEPEIPPQEEICPTIIQNSCPGPKPQPKPQPEPQPYAAYQAAMPYPLIKPQCQNPRYAAAMLENMNGQVSEMSSIHYYLYNQLTASEFKELAEVFYHISIVEMRHLEIFGKLAMKLGENPRPWIRRSRGAGYTYWSPAWLRYPPFPISFVPAPAPENSAVKLALSQAIEGENAAVKKYMQQTSWIQDVNVCDNLSRIAADEQVHADIFTRLYHKY